MKYKQTTIPKITIPKYWYDLSVDELKKLSSKTYKDRWQGKKAFNKSVSVFINFSGQGKNKRVFGGPVYPEKVATLLILKQLLEVAEYSNFGDRKDNDPKEMLGYLNFKAKCFINGNPKQVRISAMLFKNMKIDWNHEVNIKK